MSSSREYRTSQLYAIVERIQNVIVLCHRRENTERDVVLCHRRENTERDVVLCHRRETTERHSIMLSSSEYRTS
jgi:hypothetical protein